MVEKAWTPSGRQEAPHESAKLGKYVKHIYQVLHIHGSHIFLFMLYPNEFAVQTCGNH